MRRTLTKLLFCMIAVTMLLVLATVGYAEEEKLYEKYRYDEKFDYNGESIGHVLKSTVVMIQAECDATLEYNYLSLDVNAYFSAMEKEVGKDCSYEDAAAKLREYLDCEDYSVFDSFVVLSGESSEYNIGCYGSGSGAVISEDGYIATNSHVITVSESDIYSLYLSDIYGLIYADCCDVAEDLYDYCGVEMSSYEIGGLAEYILYNKNVCELEMDVERYVYFPSRDGSTDLNDAFKCKAEIVYDSGVTIDNGNDGLTKDLAILRIDKAKNLVSLAISESYPQSNSAIHTAGFPGMSDRIFEEMGSTASMLSATIETGSVSRVVAVSGQQYSAIQISNSLAQGNSGGPSVDKNLEIEGLNTYIVNDNTGTTGKAYMIPAEYILDMLDDEDIEIQRSEITLNFLTGVQMLQLGYGDAAEECFEYVKKNQKRTPYIDDLIDLAQECDGEYPDVAEDEEDDKDDEKENESVGENEAVNDENDDGEDGKEAEKEDKDEKEAKDNAKKDDGSSVMDDVKAFFEDNLVLVCCIGGGVLLLAGGLVVLLVLLKKNKKKKALAAKIEAIKSDEEKAKVVAEAESCSEKTVEVPVVETEAVAAGVPISEVTETETSKVSAPEIPAASEAAPVIVSTMRAPKPEENTESSEGSEFFRSADMDL